MPTAVVAARPTIGVPGPIAPAKPITFTPTNSGLRVWSGEGPPPPPGLVGIAVGETYIDTLTGTIYRLDPGE